MGGRICSVKAVWWYGIESFVSHFLEIRENNC